MSVKVPFHVVGAVALVALASLSVPAAAADFVSLFDGQSLDGWKVKPAACDEHWSIQDGLIVAENPNKKGSLLWTTQEYTDYELKLQYKTPSEYYDSGVMLRGNGHQVQIGISGSLQVDMTGCIYAPKDKRGSYPARSDKIADVHRVGEWNDLRIVLRGKRIQTFLNGQPFVDYKGVAINDSGPIGLQLHGGHHMKMLFRDIQVRELD